MDNSIRLTEDSNVEFVDIHAAGPAEFAERLLREFWPDAHEQGYTTVDVVYEEEIGGKTLYVVRIETEKSD